MALAVVGGALLSSFLAVLFDRMASRPVVDFIKGQKITTGLLQKLKMKLWEWLDELKDVLYHADDLLDEIKTEALSRKLEEESGSSSTNDQVLNSIHEFDKSLEPRILEILNRLDFIVNEKDVLNLKEGVKDRLPARLPTTSLVEESGVYGRDEDKETIVNSGAATLPPTVTITQFNGLMSIGSNPLPNLRKLTVRWCPKLTGRFILDYFPKLESLELKDVDIESLTISQESNSPKLLPLVHLRALAIVRCSKLRSLPHEMHTLLPSLTRLSICNCPKLEPFPEEALPSKLESLHIISCKKLIGNLMQWGLSTLTSLLLLRVSLEGFADSFPNEGLLPTTLTKLYIYRISRLDGKGFRQLTSLKKLSIEDCSELQCLPEEGLPTSLSYLRIYGCPLLEQRCQRETGEDWAKIAHIKTIWMNDNLI
ncbi:hypothetical protein M0R45_015340 [Rubus argutus]|uniref:Disease resistance N-terminal domain-containing protein n=1 Tax=Rubus argutus TaxID=59490 RepID=A0AAW1XQA0_RUBAR